MKTFAWRQNVLALFGMGYMLVAIIFLSLVFGAKIEIDKAYQMVDGAVMALIGGSIAVAHLLIDGDQSEATEQPQKQDQDGDTEPSAHENNGE